MNFHKHPNFPITPKQIAEACIEARQAGAAVAHIHVRDPETGDRSADPAHFREVVERIRDSGSDILINLTTGEGGRFVPSENDPRVAGEGTTLNPPEVRVRHVIELRPDICTLDMGTMNFGEHVFMNTPGHLRRMAGLIKDAGVKPELEVFEAGHIRLANEFIEQGLIESPPLFQLCLGIAYGAPAKATTSLNFFGIKDDIEFIVEDNKLKHGKFIPGVNIPIKNKKFIKDKKNTLVVMAWNFFKEIVDNNKNLSNNFINVKDLEKDKML